MSFVELAEGAVMIITAILAYQIYRDSDNSNDDDDE